jgi:predicted DCC family thiol-disulfide oxidoreductase YuxK
VTVSERRHILFYDGVCGLCDRLVQFVLRRDRRRRFAFAALQSDVAAQMLRRFGRDAADLDTVYVLTSDGLLRSKGRAILFVMRTLGLPWSILSVFSLLPWRVVDWCYDRVAHNRYRLFGKSDQCRLPSPEERSRFIG